MIAHANEAHKRHLKTVIIPWGFNTQNKSQFEEKKRA